MSRKKTPTAAQRTDLAPSDRGAQAYRDGLPLEANPFDIESDDAFAWQDGWDQAEAEASDAEKPPRLRWAREFNCTGSFDSATPG